MNMHTFGKSRKGGGYEAPALEQLEIRVEAGFAASDEYGDNGAPGKDLEENDYTWEGDY